MKLLMHLWRKTEGGLIAAEYLMIGTLLTIGLLVGIRAVQAALLQELQDLVTLITGP